MAPPGFCNRVEVRYWSRVRSPPVPVVLSVYQRGSLLDGLAMYLSCDTKKFHDNESTHILYNFWTSTHRGKLPTSPLAAPLNASIKRRGGSTTLRDVSKMARQTGRQTDRLQTDALRFPPQRRQRNKRLLFYRCPIYKMSYDNRTIILR